MQPKLERRRAPVFTYMKPPPPFFPGGLNAFHTSSACSGDATIAGTKRRARPSPLPMVFPAGFPQNSRLQKHYLSRGRQRFITFEQDWLDNNALVAQHIGDSIRPWETWQRLRRKENDPAVLHAASNVLSAGREYPTLTSIRWRHDGVHQGFGTAIFLTAVSHGRWDCSPGSIAFQHQQQIPVVISCVVTGGSSRVGQDRGRGPGKHLPAQARRYRLSSATFRRFPRANVYQLRPGKSGQSGSLLSYTTMITISKRICVGARRVRNLIFLSAQRLKGFPRRPAHVRLYWFS